jgi:hypothetical protein
MLSSFVEYLDSVIRRVRYNYGIIWTHGNASRPSKKSSLAVMEMEKGSLIA